jgi:hypothetical protein
LDAVRYQAPLKVIAICVDIDLEDIDLAYLAEALLDTAGVAHLAEALLDTAGVGRQAEAHQEALVGTAGDRGQGVAIAAAIAAAHQEALPGIAEGAQGLRVPDVHLPR